MIARYGFRTRAWLAKCRSGGRTRVLALTLHLSVQIYLDTSFFHDMETRFGGGGNLAFAYVISHEVAHHVENLLGLLDRLEGRHGNARNAASVEVELVADCLAGVWAGQMDARRHNLDERDVAQAIATASAIGDDRLQYVCVCARARACVHACVCACVHVCVGWLE